jgi:hypothetical protein
MAKAAYRLRVIAEHLWKSLEAIRAATAREPADFARAKARLELVNMMAEAAVEAHPVRELYATEAAG